jgi:hypothetical protein
MAYLVDIPDIADETLDVQELQHRLDSYYRYVESVRERLPPAAYAFAIADWHYNTGDPRCPHDSWVDELNLDRVPSLSTFNREQRQKHKLEIRVRLLGAGPDGFIELVYHGVRRYWPADDSDWLYDEVQLSDEGLVVHHIRWASGACGRIECEDIVYDWQPFAPEPDEKKASSSIHGKGEGP